MPRGLSISPRGNRSSFRNLHVPADLESQRHSGKHADSREHDPGRAPLLRVQMLGDQQGDTRTE